MIILSFLFLIVFLYAILHGFLYFTIVSLFDVSNPQTKWILILVLVLLGASFIISSFLAHIFNNSFFRGYYYASGLWIGFLINFSIAIAISWSTVFLLGKIDFTVNKNIITIFAITISILLSIFGAWNAMHPKVTNVSVKINNLPVSWKGKNIVQISDVHLGFIYRQKFADEMVEEVNQLDPDIVVITGDLFDGSDGDLDWVANSIGNLKARDGIYFVTGNHETYLGLEKVFGVLGRAKNITILRDDMVNLNGLQIVGIDYPQAMHQRNQKDLNEVFEKVGLDRSKPSLLLNHAPVQIQQAINAGISLQLSGHTHRGQLFPFQFITRIVYKSYDYGLVKKGNFNIYTTPGIGTWGPAMRTDSRPEIVNILLD